MNILFVMRHGTYLRNYGSVLGALAGRGHVVHVGFNRTKDVLAGDLNAYQQSLSDGNPRLRFDRLPPRSDYWATLAHQLRMFRHYLRYLHPRYRNATGLTERCEKRVFRLARLVKYLPFVRRPAGLNFLSHLLRLAERAIPSDRAVEAVVRSYRPDLVVVTPLVDFERDQVDYLKAAKRLGVPTVLGVASWDNLTNKGVIAIDPDLVLVWNEAQRKEAVELHGLASNKVVVTGAQLFDQWFDRRPGTTREAFCGHLDFDPAKPLLLYLCSSSAIAPREVEFVGDWLQQMRTRAPGVLREANVLIRPHPANTGPWDAVDLAGKGRVAVWPRRGGFPVGPSAQADFFDSLHHSSAVVGVNTTALIEAGIVGRRCFTIQAQEVADGQAGMLHFDHLRRSDFLMVAPDFDRHFEQLHQELTGKTDGQRCIGEFLQSFVRPHGLDEPATPRVVTAIETLAQEPAPRPDRTPAWLLPLRWALAPAALLAHWLHRTGKRRRGRTAVAAEATGHTTGRLDGVSTNRAA